MYAALFSFGRSYQEIQKPRSTAAGMNASPPLRCCVLFEADYSRLRARSQVPGAGAPSCGARPHVRPTVEDSSPRQESKTRTEEPRDGHIPGLGPRAHWFGLHSPSRTALFRSRSAIHQGRAYIRPRPIPPAHLPWGELERGKARRGNGGGGTQNSIHVLELNTNLMRGTRCQCYGHKLLSPLMVPRGS
jgi:hypothetical protein